MASSNVDNQNVDMNAVRDNHGSGAGQVPASAMAPSGPALLATSGALAATAAGAADGADQSLELSSDDSPNATGAKMRMLVARPTHTPRTSPSPGRRAGSVKSKTGTATRGRSGLRTARNLSRGPGGIPNPLTMREIRDQDQPMVTEHVLAPSGRAYGESDVETRLSSLEKQRDLDHTYLNGIAKHLQALIQAQEFQQNKLGEHEKGLMEFAKLNVEMRKGYANLRDETERRFKGIEATIPEIITASLEERVAKVLQGVMDKTETAFETLKGQVAEAFGSLAEIQGQRPRDGQIIQGAFQQANRDLEQVKDFVRVSLANTSTTTVPSTDPNAVPFTQTMFNEIKETIHKVRELEKLGGVVDLMNIRAEVIGKNSEQLVGTVTAHGERIRMLEASTGNTGGNGGHQCGTCGPAGGGLGLQGCGGGPPPAPGLNTSQGLFPGSSGDGDPLGLMKGIIGGNGQCHCKHVEDLIKRVSTLEQAGGRAGARGFVPGTGSYGTGPGNGDDPLQANDAWRRPRDGDPVPRDPRGRRILPLDLPEPLGAAGYKEKALFDEKLTTQAEYRYDGAKDGAAWKSKVERHFISRAPVLKNLLAWAEEEELEAISVDKLQQAAGIKFDGEQCMIVNAAIWGFLSAATSGTAEIIFEGAQTLNGFDAWRRLARSIEKGKSVRLEQLRREVKLLYLKKIPSLDRVEEGIASFENKIREYTSLGGTAQSNDEMKQDLLNILPGDLSSQLLWRASDDGPYSSFRDHILNMTNKILMNDKGGKGRIGAVDAEKTEPYGVEGNDDQEFFNMSGISNFDDLVLAVNKFNNRRRAGQRPQPGPRGQGATPPAGDRGPRQCPNCNGTHAERKCPKAAIPVADRTCWTCGKKNHTSRDCPDKGKALRAIVDDKSATTMNWIGIVDHEGFRQPHPRRTVHRPTPRQTTLGDFLSKNMFSDISTLEDVEGSAYDEEARVAPSMPDAPIPSEVAPRAGSVPVPRLAGRLRPEGRESTNKTKTATATFSTLSAEHHLGMLYEEEEDVLAAMAQQVKIKVAMDSGAVANVIHPRELPEDAEPEPNETGKHFSGAGGGRITKYGFCKTVLESEGGEKVGCNWSLADVTRPLHAVSQVTGPADEPGRQDVLFTNRRCVVVPPGIVDKIMKEHNIKPVLEYQREGNLYLAEMAMSSFRRQGQDA